jgi:hypothetical protein
MHKLRYVHAYVQGRFKYRSREPKHEKTPMSRLPVTSLEFDFGLPVTSLEVSQVLTLVFFHAWARPTYAFSGLDICRENQLQNLDVSLYLEA